MKKILLASITILLLAAGCNKQPAKVQPVQNQQPSQQQETKPADETANWKIYTNDKNGFEMKYPQEWKLIGFTDNAFTVATSDQCKDDNSIEKLAEQYKGCQRLSVWVGDISKANYSDNPDNYFRINIGGETGEKYIVNQPYQSKIDGKEYYNPRAEISAQIFHKGQWYKFSLNFHHQQINYALNLFDKFIKTFKFTK